MKKLLVALGVAALSTGAMAQNLFSNGSFEANQIPERNHRVIGTDGKIDGTNDYFVGWTVGGQVDLVNGQNPTLDQWYAADGNNSIDMNGFVTGSIGQSIFLSSDSTYTLTYMIAGNPNRVQPSPAIKKLNVYVGDTLLVADSFDTTGKTGTNVGWEQRTYSLNVTESKNYFVRFQSLEDGPRGPALDAVSLTMNPNNPGNNAVPEPSEWAVMGLLGTGLLGLVVRGRKKTLGVAK